MNTKEINFAYKIRHALNENLDNLPATSVDRLATARSMALARKKSGGAVRASVVNPAFAGRTGNFMGTPWSFIGRLGVAAPILAGIIIFVGLYQFEEQQRIREIAELDAAVLSDDLPLSAYLDNGFNAYLAKPDQ